MRSFGEDSPQDMFGVFRVPKLETRLVGSGYSFEMFAEIHGG